MAKYTAEVREIIDRGFTIIDFTYNRTPESVAVLSNADLEKGFIDHYFFREIGFETLERFKKRLEVQWKESLGEFDALLVAYAKPLDPMVNNQGTTGNTTVYNDTPDDALDFGVESTHASNIVDQKTSSKGASNITQIELLEKYHEKIKDIQTEFYNSFDNLFMQLF